MDHKIPQAWPVDDHDREDRAGLIGHVEQIRAPTKPVLSYQQVPSAGNRKELSDALNDAEQHDLQEIVHTPPLARTWERNCIIFVRR
jgi:hypothetical protein